MAAASADMASMGALGIVSGAARGVGKANAPKSTLPRDKSGNYLPDPAAEGRAHTVLGTREGRAGSYTQGATFDNNGIFKGVTDVTTHGVRIIPSPLPSCDRPKQHPAWTASAPRPHGSRPMTNVPTYMQICVPCPPDGVSGAVAGEWIATALEELDLPWSAVCDVDVSGLIREELFVGARETRVMETALLLERVRSAEQVVWLTAFFCGTVAAAKSISAEESYQDSTRKAALVLRVVDASYLYVIAPMPLGDALAKRFPGADLKVGALEEMDFPE